ncbi:alpha/beta hydrolase [Pararhizobium sp.]|uniref:alpha/beta hydrolase n=1 Tax=Pararhizobium sp. TaxID=1977563 RepID=UPI00271E42D8|nr:alpha/beta hydrolase [Pararhizobium sp.]MDO9416950.1 alpha/beta fold hydrolase [Pararhizobium sp.]
MSGPRTPADFTVRFDASTIGTDPAAWLAASEARFSDIRPGLQKEIIWADPVAKARTPVSIVYIHGFSASKGEVRPLPDILAKNLKANLFYTRLAGHGRSNDAMGEASLNDWVNDTAEAIAIGERLGDRVVVIATSTGATLTAFALTRPALSSKIVAAVFISPNFAIKARGSSLLTVPWSNKLARAVLGARRSFTPLNALHASLWTTEYPVGVLLPMAELVKRVAALSFSEVRTPTLFVYSPQDQVVDATATDAVVKRWGGITGTIDPGAVEDPFRHVIAGDALSPAATTGLAEKISDWLHNTL